MAFDSIQACFASQAARTPDAVAITSDGRWLTYRELDERGNRLAHRLLDLGVGAEEPVAVLMERSPELVVAILGILKAGASYLPLHSAQPPARIQWVLDEVGTPVLLTDQLMRARGVPAARRTVILDPREPAAAPAADPAVPTGPDRLAYVMHTSGSEGSPTGVGVAHRGVLSMALDPCWRGGAYDRVLMLAPYAFGVSTFELWVPLLGGGRIVLAPPGEFGVRALRRAIDEHGVTALHLTAGLFRVVAEEAPDCLAGVREVLTGGDLISPSAVERVLAACPDIVVRAMYGATEVSSFVVTSPMRAPFRAGSSVPVGRGMSGVGVYILDESLAPVPPGAVGDLYLAGDRVARGYYGRAAATAERYVADPFAGGGKRMYRTGDLARWTGDGLVDFAGRASDQVKIRGYRVELAEVESALAKHPSLAQAVVVARPVTPGEHRLDAYVVGNAGEVDVAALRDHTELLLPGYMIPATFTVLGSLPLTPNGKIDRRALPEPVAAGGADYRAPGSPRQEVLCSLFAEVLGVARVGLDDSFFDLDGQSLLAIRLASRIQSTLGVDVSVTDLFDAPTVAELDSRLRSR